MTAHAPDLYEQLKGEITALALDLWFHQNQASSLHYYHLEVAMDSQFTQEPSVFGRATEWLRGEPYQRSNNDNPPYQVFETSAYWVGWLSVKGGENVLALLVSADDGALYSWAFQDRWAQPFDPAILSSCNAQELNDLLEGMADVRFTLFEENERLREMSSLDAELADIQREERVAA